MATFDSIEQARVLQFKANVVHLYEQQKSRLRGTVREEPLTGKAHFFERLKPEPAVIRSVRHGDTEYLDPQHSRRMVVPKDYSWSTLVDQEDKIRMLIDATSEYALLAAQSLQLATDDVILNAFAADAAAGEDGSSAVTFASEAAFNSDFTSAALTTANILQVKRALDINEVFPEDRYIVYHPAAMEQLLKASTAPLASSSDYNTVKALVNGEMDTWVGFKWIMSNRTPRVTGDSTQPYCFAWSKSAMGLVINKEPVVRMSEMPNKNYAVQTYACMTMGATRIQGAGVARFAIDTDN